VVAQSWLSFSAAPISLSGGASSWIRWIGASSQGLPWFQLDPLARTLFSAAQLPSAL